MLPNTLKFKVAFYLAIALMAAMVLFTVLIIRHQRDQLLQEAANHVAQLSEVITRSTRYVFFQRHATVEQCMFFLSIGTTMPLLRVFEDASGR